MLNPIDEKRKRKEITRLIVGHQQQIFAFIFSLVPIRDEAEDILQDVCVEIMGRFRDFELGTNFLAWANSIAYCKVRSARTNYARCLASDGIGIFWI